MDKPHLFDEFFASGLEQSVSPFLTASSRKWGKNMALRASILAAVLLACAFTLSFFSLPIAHLLLAFVFFLVGIPALIDSFEDLTSLQINIDLLMTLSAFISLGIGREFEGALLLVLFELSGSMEKNVTQKARSAIQDLHLLSPSKAWVVEEGGHLLEKSVREISTNTQILVKAGEIVPLDGKILQGEAHYSIAHLTGEYLPLKSIEGEEVPAGAKVLDQSLTLVVTRTSNDSTLTRILNLITQASDAKPKVERFLDTWGEKYAISIISLTFLFAIGLPFLFSMDFLGYEGSIYRALTFMIAASPCALIIATPTAYLSAISACAKKGILLKGGVILDALSKCKSISFDKTGTLTTGSLQLVDIIPLNQAAQKLPMDTALQIAYGLEQKVVHPISTAIIEKVRKKNLSPYAIDSFQAEPGMGLKGSITLDGKEKKVFLGLPEGALPFIAKEELPLVQEELEKQKEEKLLSLFVIEEAVFLFAFSDEVRKDALEMVNALKESSLTTLMLTGDHHTNAQKVGSLLGIEKIHADLRPEKKLEMVASLSESQGLVMVGDGVNDAPALARATVGISMGKIGSTAAMEASDVILLQEDLHLLPWLFEKAKKTSSIVRQNLSFALFVIIFAATFALYGFIPLWLAVILHEGGTILVGLNSLRLLKK